MNFDTPIGPRAKDVLTFDFTNGLAAGEILSGTITVTVTLANGSAGKDKTPASLLNGIAQISADNKKVLVPVKGRTQGADYDIEVVAPTNNPQRVLTMVATLNCR
ncbi:MAG: hypothetical protein KGP14_09145 [Betaproteobacteria bacterium]|nr:hypothetical protein [Betaproteobacteria bacterium]